MLWEKRLFSLFLSFMFYIGEAAAQILDIEQLDWNADLFHKVWHASTDKEYMVQSSEIIYSHIL